jgi:hypothetical protein
MDIFLREGCSLMNRGYAGYYKNTFLRSSYEYAYAVYLDFFNIPWKYEVRNFDIGFKTYKPDFFLYNEDGELVKIIEVKSRSKKANEKAQISLIAILDLYDLKSELVSYEELLHLYVELPFSLNSVLIKWIKSEHTSINKSFKGKYNSHYNMKHTMATKLTIGKHTKSLWESNSHAKMRMVEGLRNSGLKQKGKIKTPREIRFCILCKNEFEVLITSNKSYCSRKCSGKSAIQLATVNYLDSRHEVHKLIRIYVLDWSVKNSELVLTTPLNRVKPTISKLLEEIFILYGIKDIRVISKAVLGKDRGRKELIRFMKEYCREKIC